MTRVVHPICEAERCPGRRETKPQAAVGTGEWTAEKIQYLFGSHSIYIYTHLHVYMATTYTYLHVYYIYMYSAGCIFPSNKSLNTPETMCYF